MDQALDSALSHEERLLWVNLRRWRMHSAASRASDRPSPDDGLYFQSFDQPTRFTPDEDQS